MHQWVKYQHQALRYQLEINGNLYFRNVSNNAGMFDAIIGAAEEQEFKEAVLAYFFLLGEPAGRDELDRKIEAWLATRFGVHGRFRARRRPREARASGAGAEAGDRLSVPPLAEALRRLDRQWDAFFAFDEPPNPASTEGTRLRA